MDRINSIEEIGEKISVIRNLRKGFVTNFYLDFFKHSIWIKKGDFYSFREGDTFFFIKKNTGFWNVFYNSTDLEELKCGLEHLSRENKDQILIFDIVGNEVQSNEISTILHEIGMTDYCSLVRMSRLTTPSEYEDSFSNIEFASINQAEEIYSLLLCHFDVKTEQIPYLEEIKEYAQQNHILIYRKENRIIGFVIFEKNKSTQYLRYWFVHPDFRDLKIGGSLLRRFFYEGKDTKRQLFWVIRSNDNAIKRYRHYGFAEENMYDLVYINSTNSCNVLSNSDLNRGKGA